MCFLILYLCLVIILNVYRNYNNVWRRLKCGRKMLTMYIWIWRKKFPLETPTSSLSGDISIPPLSIICSTLRFTTENAVVSNSGWEWNDIIQSSNKGWRLAYQEVLLNYCTLCVIIIHWLIFIAKELLSRTFI